MPESQNSRKAQPCRSFGKIAPDIGRLKQTHFKLPAMI
jgi:hypothetical protein